MVQDDDSIALWLGPPEELLHPIRVPLAEALWRTGEPLSAIALVDVLDGFLTMWEAAYHLRVLEALGVVEPASGGGPDKVTKRNRFDLPYRLTAAADGSH